MAPASVNNQVSVPTFDLQKHHSKIEVPTDFDLRDLSKRFSVFPLKVITVEGRRRLLLAMRNPFDQKAILDVEFRSGISVISVQAEERDIQWLQQVHYYGQKLSPRPSDELPEITFDVFEQVSMISDMNSQKSKKD